MAVPLRYISRALILFALFLSQTAYSGIPLPKVPAGITAPAERASYIICHFWERAEFPAVTEDAEFEQAFVNYISLFPLASSDSVRREAVSALWEKIRPGGKDCFSRFNTLAEKYLYNVDSPMLDEETYLLFLEVFMSDDEVSADVRPLLEYQRGIVLNNRVGTPVNTFRYKNKEGKFVSFPPESDGRETVLVFYDTECSHCRELIESMAGDSSRCYIAIALNANAQSFRNSLSFIPEDWLAGYDATGLVNGTIFAIRKLPDVFLISADGTVLKKHNID